MDRVFSRFLLISLIAHFFFSRTSGQTALVSSVSSSAGGIAQRGGLTIAATTGQASPIGGASASGITVGSGFEFTLGSDVSAPTIQHTPIVSQNNGQPLQISATITDNTGVANARLHYRKGGDPAFTPLLMSISGGVYQATIPSGQVTTNGIEYYIMATDLVGNVSRFPAAGVVPVQVIVGGEGLASSSAQPGGSAQNAYRLISVPMEITNNTVQSVLFDDLGAYDATKWRFYELAANQQYVEYPSASALTRGRGYWLIVSDPGKIIDTGPARSLVTNVPFTISLNQGWNFIGNPFTFVLPVTDLSLASSQSVRLRSYTGAWNDTLQPVTALQAFAGYAIYANVATTLFMNPGVSSSSPMKPSASTTANISWSIAIKARCDGARDVDNIAAVGIDAEQEFDNLDWVEPPVIGEFVSVYFPHRLPDNRTEKFCIDVRPIPMEGEVWDFELRTNIPKPVYLSFENVAPTPAEFGVLLIDEVLKSTQDLRQRSTYVVQAKQSTDPSRFKLLVGKSEFIQHQIALNRLIPESFELSQNFPNPFNPTTTIRYGLPKESHVTLKVYNLLGQEVTTLVDEVQDKGYRAVQFPPSDGERTTISSGTYFYRLQAGEFVQTKKLTVLK